MSMKNKETIEMLKGALQVQPDNNKLRTHIAQLMIEDGDLTDIDDVLTDELDVVALGNDSMATMPEVAIKLAEIALDRNKANAHAYMLLAKVHRQQKDAEQALKYYNIAAVIDESLEDSEFEDAAGYSNAVEFSKTKQKDSESRVPAMISHQGESVSEEIAEDDFVETDPALEALLNQNLVDFSDVGGMDELKERIRMSIIYPFKNKELFKKFKKKIGGGILMYGPPGCGKTLIAKATAGECGAHFMNISIHDILSKWIGESEHRVHELFETARRKSPTIIFIDEIDAMCIKRSDAGHTASLVNSFLTEIDGATSNNEDVLVIGATNTPWRIDSAFRRPGRFDHVLFVPPPDTGARESIFDLALNDIPQDKIDVRKLAKISEKFSGADIAATVSAAGEEVIQEIMRTGKESKVSEKNLLKAVKKHRPTTLEWLEQAANYASYANQSGLYDDLADYIKKG